MGMIASGSVDEDKCPLSFALFFKEEVDAVVIDLHSGLFLGKRG